MERELEMFLAYLRSAKGHSELTIKEYYYDLRLFFRYMVKMSGKLPDEYFYHDGKKNRSSKSSSEKRQEMEEAIEKEIAQLDLQSIQRVTKRDIYGYISYLDFTRKLTNRSKSRKLTALRSFFHYLVHVAEVLEKNPAEEVELPKIGKTLPEYLTLDQAEHLLDTIIKAPGRSYNRWRDYTMAVFFLNTGLRLSELSALDVEDVLENHTLHIVGKGNKKRSVYITPACEEALKEYLPLRKQFCPDKDVSALFLSNRRTRLSHRGIQRAMEKHIQKAGFDPSRITVHKLRHTAATLMYRYGEGDLRALQELLGHESVQTTQIYTHVENEAVRKTAFDNPLSKKRNHSSTEQ